jgi:PAS domain S-box-containing protein
MPVADGTPTAPSDDRPLRIGFTVCDPGLSFGAIVSLGAKERAAELGVELTAISVYEPSEQAAIIRRLGHEGVDAVIVEALESRIVVPALHELEEAGIPIVIADMGIAAVRAACTVRSDNVGGAELAASYLVARLGGKGKLAHLRGLPTSENGVERTRGFHNVIDRCPGIEIVFEGTSEWTSEAGANLMGRVLAEHPDVQAVFAGNDPLALGAVEAIAQTGRSGEIIVAGFDALPDALLAIERGTLAATVRQSPRSMGRLAVEMAVRAARGEEVPAIVTTEVTLVTQAEVAEASLAALPLFPRILRDLTDSHAALMEERSLLRTLIDNLPDLIYIKDPASRFVVANPGLLRLVGASRAEDVIGKTDFDFFPADLAAKYYADEQAIIASGVPLINQEERSIDAAGTPRWFSTTKVLAEDSIGNVVGLVGMNRDITDHKQLEAQLRHAQKMETVGQLAGGIAHDFNNLLTVIAGYVNLLLSEVPKEHPMHADLLEVQKAAGRGATLSQQLLAFARKQVLEPRVIDLNDLVVELGNLMRRLIGEQVELRTQLCGEPLSVRVDPGQIEQVLVNLAVNARDAMPAGGKLTITTSPVLAAAGGHELPFAPQQGEYALVTVSDTGKGMSANVLARAFEPFFTTKEVGKGTGLGLAMSLGVIEQHGGHIWAASELGMGTTIRFCLPTVHAREFEPPAREPAVGEGRGSETVLIVEDEDAVRTLATRVLREHGYNVLEAASGEQGLELASRHDGQIDLVLSDVVMPGMGGVAVAERLAAERPGVKLLFMSGYTRSAIDQMGWLEAGVVLLPKPFTPADLVRHVREALSALPLGANGSRRPAAPAQPGNAGSGGT